MTEDTQTTATTTMTEEERQDLAWSLYERQLVTSIFGVPFPEDYEEDLNRWGDNIPEDASQEELDSFAEAKQQFVAVSAAIAEVQQNAASAEDSSSD